MTTKHGRLKKNDSPWTIDEKTTIGVMVLTNKKKTKEKTRCEGKLSYMILEQVDLQRSLLMIKNPTQPN